MDSSTGAASAIREMAHIVGEKAAAARGESVLPRAEQNAYSNLILLCPTHQTVIDKKENEFDFPVEVLHGLKDAHEERVRTAFARNVLDRTDDPSEALYAELVARYVERLTGLRTTFRPVVRFPGWIVQSANTVRDSDEWSLNDNALGKWIEIAIQASPVLDDPQVARIAEALSARCRWRPSPVSTS